MNNQIYKYLSSIDSVYIIINLVWKRNNRFAVGYLINMSHTIINQLEQNYIDRVFISQLTSKHRMNNLWSWTMFSTHCLYYKESSHTLYAEFTVHKYSLYSSKLSGISHSNYVIFFRPYESFSWTTVYSGKSFQFPK